VYVSTERLILRRFRETDVDAAHGLLGDPACAAYFDGRALTWAETVDLIEGAIARDPFEEIAVSVRGSGQLIGIVRAGPFLHGDHELGGKELRWAVHRDYWGQGVATEAVGTLMEEVFIDASVTHVVAYCEREHLRTRKVAEKLGMVEERVITTPPVPVAAEVFGTTSLELREAEPIERAVSPTLVKYVYTRPGARRTFQPL
jgi:ribosomal-protein-alanine N-acetyltransferase